MGETYRKFGPGLSLRWLVLLVVFALLVGFVLGKKAHKGPALTTTPVDKYAKARAFNDSFELKNGYRLLKEYDIPSCPKSSCTPEESLKLQLNIPLDQPRVHVSKNSSRSYTVIDSVKMDSIIAIYGYLPPGPILKIPNVDSSNREHDSFRAMRCETWYRKRPDALKSVMNCRCNHPYSIGFKDSCRVLGLPQ